LINEKVNKNKYETSNLNLDQTWSEDGRNFTTVKDLPDSETGKQSTHQHASLANLADSGRYSGDLVSRKDFETCCRQRVSLPS